MTTPLPLWHGIVLEQMLVGAAASLVNLIIHALLLALVVWTVRGIALREHFVPSFVRYTLVIVLTGTLLMAGHFVEVMVWAITYGLVGIAPPSIQLIYLAFDNYTTLGYADLVAPEQWRLLRPMTALNGIMLIGWSTALIIEILRRSVDRDSVACRLIANLAASFEARDLLPRCRKKCLQVFVQLLNGAATAILQPERESR